MITTEKAVISSGIASLTTEGGAYMQLRYERKQPEASRPSFFSPNLLFAEKTPLFLILCVEYCVEGDLFHFR